MRHKYSSLPKVASGRDFVGQRAIGPKPELASRRRLTKTYRDEASAAPFLA
jgi:hypothetical protein